MKTTAYFRHTVVRLSELRTQAIYFRKKYLDLFYDLMIEYTNMRLALLDNEELQSAEQDVFIKLCKIGIQKAFQSQGVTLTNEQLDKISETICPEVFNIIQGLKRNIFEAAQKLAKARKDD